MNKKTAIRILKDRKSKIEKEYGNDFIWSEITLSHFEYFFGKDSHEYKLMKQFDHLFRSEEKESSKEFTRQRLARVIDEAISTVDARGIVEHPKSNFLRRLSDAWLTTITVLLFTVLFPAVFYTGMWVQRQEQKKLPTGAPNSIPNNITKKSYNRNDTAKH